MKHLFLIFLFISTISYSQSKTDSLNKLIQSVSGKEKINLLIKLSHELSKTDTTGAINKAKQAKKFSEYQNYTEGIVNSEKSIISIYSQAGNKNEVIRRSFLLLNSQYTLERSDSSFIYSTLRSTYYNVGAYNMSAECNKEQIKLTDSDFNKATLYNQLGQNYIQLEDYINACEAFHNMLFHISKTDNTFYKMHAYNNLGITHYLDKQLDSALYYYDVAIKMIENKEVENPVMHGIIIGNIGLTYLEQGKYKEAIPLIEKDKKICKKSHEMPSLVNTYIRLGEAYRKVGNYSKARINLDSVATIIDSILTARPEKNISEKNSYTYKRMRLLEEYALYYETIQDNKRSLQYYKEHNTLKDSINKAIQKEETQSFEMRYKLARFEKELAEQQNLIDKKTSEAIRNELKLDARVNQLHYLTAISVLFLILLLLLLRNYRKSRKVNTELKENALTIEHSLKEKEILLKEIHHRVKNNLQVISSLLDLQTNQIEDEDILLFLNESQNRVKSMALIHQKLYESNDLSDVSFQEYIEQLVSNLSMSLQINDKSIEKNINTAGLKLNVETAIPLGLIINELVSNSFKHAFKDMNSGEINIDLKKLDDSFFLVISDNGKGLPDDFDISTTKSLGLKLVKMLSRQLKGNFDYESKNGTRFYINFKEQ